MTVGQFSVELRAEASKSGWERGAAQSLLQDNAPAKASLTAARRKRRTFFVIKIQFNTQ